MKSFLRPQKCLSGDKRSLRERLRLEGVNTDAIAHVGKKTARTSKETTWTGDATITWADDVPETTWRGNSVAEAEGAGTAAFAATGFSSLVADAEETTREGDQGGDAM